MDSDGLSGADNSHYVPSFNRLAFGHGCVDDNEDVDVILHEYGHALTHGINSSWGGGDSGAIGEGFGDYWAETYSFTTANGASFQPDKVFDWDGIADCWPGRRLNVTGVQYDPNRTYGAHQSIGSDVQSDELWSTPIYQSFVELRGQGVAREEVDKIVARIDVRPRLELHDARAGHQDGGDRQGAVPCRAACSSLRSQFPQARDLAG